MHTITEYRFLRGLKAQMLASRTSRPAIKQRNNAGQALVEFAFVFILFVMLTVGMVSMARAVNIYEAVSAAAREGTHYGVANANSSSNSNCSAVSPGIQSVVNYQLTVAGLDPTLATVNVSCPADSNPLVFSGTDVKVQVSYPFTPPFVSSTSITLSASSLLPVWKINRLGS